MLEAGCQALCDLGYKTTYCPSILDHDLYFAGSAERRIHELHEMFSRDDVRAIVCARGGYGTNYLLKQLDLKQIRSHPKIFVGYSDVTSLLAYVCDAAGLVTFHGPMVAKDFSHPGGVDSQSWLAALSSTPSWVIEPNPEVRALATGSAEGILYGGCLSMLAASLGTPYEIHTTNTILFVEDIAAKPYQIDRMLMQLKLAGKFDRVRGLIFGEMLDCAQTQNQSYTLEEVILRVVGDLRIPIAYGLRSGHVSGSNITLPFGVNARLEIGTGISIQILEAATSAE